MQRSSNIKPAGLGVDAASGATKPTLQRSFQIEKTGHEGLQESLQMGRTASGDLLFADTESMAGGASHRFAGAIAKNDAKVAATHLAKESEAAAKEAAEKAAKEAAKKKWSTGEKVAVGALATGAFAGGVALGATA